VVQCSSIGNSGGREITIRIPEIEPGIKYKPDYRMDDDRIDDSWLELVHSIPFSNQIVHIVPVLRGKEA
jgi:hypothetical protein